MFRRIHRQALLFAALLVVFPAPAAQGGEARLAPPAVPRLIRQCEGGRLYQCGSQRVLALQGTPYQMGLAHGRLLRDEARRLCGNVLTFVRAADDIKHKDYYAGSIEKAYKRLAPFIPKRFQEEMRGLADGTGLPLRDVQLANVFPALFHCSGFTLAGKATKGGQLLHGRILDYMTVLGIQDCAVTVFARPTGRRAWVNVTYAGFIGSVTGMNDRRIAVGEMGGGGEGRWDGMPMPMLVRLALEEAGTLDQALAVFRKTPRTCEYYYVVSDGKTGASRGLYCTPEICQVLKPGQKDPRLAVVLPDTVMFSGTDRLKALAARVKARYGTLDAPAVLEIMTRPVSMKDNLHNVLFAPASGQMWVAHAHTDVSREKFQSCYQPYHHYRLEDLAKLLPPAPTTVPKTPPALAAATSRPAEKEVVMGRVPIGLARKMLPAGDEAMATLLKPFEPKPAAFGWGTRLVNRSGSFVVRTIAFPSPYTSPVKCNNIVHGEYFLAAGDERDATATPRRPAVIVLHILDGRFTVARAVCNRLALAGIHSLLVKMPYYGPRRPKDTQALERSMRADPDLLIAGVKQAVMDVRRAARWLAARPEVDARRIGLCGVSLGGFVAATTAGVDGRFPRVAVLLAGGDLTTVLNTQAREVRKLKEAIAERGWDADRLKRLLDPIDPLTYASRLRRSHVLMINGRTDGIVPASCAEKLAKAADAKIIWYPANHYSMVMYVPAALGQMIGHFLDDDWSFRRPKP